MYSVRRKCTSEKKLLITNQVKKKKKQNIYLVVNNSEIDSFENKIYTYDVFVVKNVKVKFVIFYPADIFSQKKKKKSIVKFAVYGVTLKYIYRTVMFGNIN